MYAQLIGRMAAEPQGAAETVPKLFGTRLTSSATIGKRKESIICHGPLTVLFDGNRSHARSAAAVWNAEGFVEVEVGDVAAVVAWSTDAHLGVHVGAVQVHLGAAARVNHVADFADVLIKDAKSGGMSLINAAVLEHKDGLHLHAGHVGADDAQAGVLALGAGVGLKGDVVVARQRAQVVLQLVDQQLVALGLRRWLVGNEIKKQSSTHQRNHRVDQRDVLVLQLFHVPNQIRLTVVLVEERVHKEGRPAGHRPTHQRTALRPGLVVHHLFRLLTLKDPEEVGNVLVGDGLVEGDADVVAVRVVAQVDALRLRPGPRPLDDGHLDFERVKGIVGEHPVDAGLLDAPRQVHRLLVNVLGDGLQPLRAVVDGEHGAHVGEQRLRRADVRGGLVAANVLLAGLQRQPEGLIAVGYITIIITAIMLLLGEH
ncbi:hypothetical protein TYRP_001671 [Tyrophagus putrescentiae]|nr:hypothetical protein TYRP_001671 [Tyrophagus putrescentiae]